MGKVPAGLAKFLASKKKGKKGKVVKKGKSVKATKVVKGKKKLTVKPVVKPQMGMGEMGKGKKPSAGAMAYVKKVGM